MRLWPDVTPLLLAVLCASSGCDDLSEYRGDFAGHIVEGEFVRGCFSSGTELTLVFDPERAVAPIPGMAPKRLNRMTTSDGTFTDTVLEPITALPHDPLSQLDFPGPRRLRNYLLLARPESGPLAGRDATVVVSLLAEDRIEVRVIGRTAEGTAPCAAELESAGDAGVELSGPRVREYFGLFRLK